MRRVVVRVEERARRRVGEMLRRRLEHLLLRELAVLGGVGDAQQLEGVAQAEVLLHARQQLTPVQVLDARLETVKVILLAAALGVSVGAAERFARVLDPAQRVVARDHLVEALLRHGLRQVVSHPVRHALVAVARHRVRRQRDDRRRLEPKPLLRTADETASLVAVHDGHVAIHEDQVVPKGAAVLGVGLGGGLVAARLKKQLERLGAVPRLGHDVAHFLKHRLDDLHIELVVLRHQHARRALRGRAVAAILLRLAGAVGDEHRLVEHLLLRHLLEVLCRVGLLELQREVERGAVAVGGVDPNLAAHQLDELLADGEAQADT
mmetsp:Transcript_14755/g.39386  ORF Transcript_14755/g.39386 Transcript_14755/m.39386 type:complete len:322 (+) Transcript_14755:1809-2774(+)